jgi:hypothetical protein
METEIYQLAQLLDIGNLAMGHLIQALTYFLILLPVTWLFIKRKKQRS